MSNAMPLLTEWTTDNAPDDPVMISALEHYSYCPRQCALIHIEQTFDENIYTMRGKATHAHVDEVISEIQDGATSEDFG